MVFLYNLNFFCLHSLLSSRCNVGHSLSFLQAFESIRLDGFEVNEKIITAIFGRDEAKAFFIVKPFNRTGFSN
jgi:hypothetical protein